MRGRPWRPRQRVGNTSDGHWGIKNMISRLFASIGLAGSVSCSTLRSNVLSSVGPSAGS